MIEGVRTKPLKWLGDDRGRLMEILRCNDEIFKGFGQVYVTCINPGIVKGWHWHKFQDDSFVPMAGQVRVGLHDAREDSPTQGESLEFLLTPDDPFIVQIPRLVLHGMENVGETEGMVMNLPNMPYSHEHPDEHRVDPFDNDIPFKWKATRGG